jgi:predicted PurR-regulated permease PerM
MQTPTQSDIEIDKRVSTRLLDVMIRAGLIAALTALCYKVFAPFLTLMVWAIILGVTLYPAQQWLARKFRGKKGLASTLIVILGCLLIIAPTAVLLSSLGDSLHGLIKGVQDNTLEIPAPRPGVADWPIVGKQLHDYWAKAHDDLPGLVQSMQPKIGDLTRKALGIVAGLGAQLLLFVASLIIAGILMAFGENGARGSRAVFDRVIDNSTGEQFVRLAAATIRAVAQGVIGVALIQAIIIGLALLIANVPWAGVLAVVSLILGIAQVPALFVTLPAIIYIWSSGDYSTGIAVVHSVILVIAGMADNILKPLLLGRGVDVPMPVILFGALGGMASAGILGMFVGAVLLTLGYEIFMKWVASNPRAQ